MGNNINNAYTTNINSNNNSTYTVNNNYNPLENTPLNNLCGTSSSHETILNTHSNEIILTSTYCYPKGTYTNDSIRLFSRNEKLLFHFISKNNIAAIRYLIMSGVNINILDEDRTSPLHVACACSSLEVVEEILNQGAMINIPDIVGWTALHIACYCLRADVVLLLLKKGAHYKTKNRDRKTAKDVIDVKRGGLCMKVIEGFERYEKEKKAKMEMNGEGDVYGDVVRKFVMYQKLKEEYLATREDGEDGFVDEMEVAVEGFGKEVKKEKARDLERYVEEIVKGVDDGWRCCCSGGLEEEGECKDKEDNMNKDEDEDNINGKCRNPIKDEEVDYMCDIEEIPSEFILNNNDHNKKSECVSKTCKCANCNSNNHNNDSIVVPEITNIISQYKFLPKRHKFYLTYRLTNNTLQITHHSKSKPKPSSSTSSIHHPTTFPFSSNFTVLHPPRYNPPSIEDNPNNNNILYTSHSFSSFSSSSSSNTTIDLSTTPIQSLFDCIPSDDIQLFPSTILPLPHPYLSSTFQSNLPLYNTFLTTIYLYDASFATAFLLSNSALPNSLSFLFTYINTVLSNQQLINSFLSSSSPNPLPPSKLLRFYFNSFSYANMTYLQALLTTFQHFELSLNNIERIDCICKAFTQTLYTMKQPFRSENAMYHFTFAFVIAVLKFSKQQQDKHEMICDFIMMIKYLNEGKDYDTSFIIDCMKEVLNGNVMNMLKEKEMCNRDTRLVKGKVILKGNDVRKVNVAFRKGVFVCCKQESNVKEIEMCVHVDKETMRCDVERKGKEFVVMIRKTKCDKEFVVIRRTEYVKGVIMYEECAEMCVCVDDEEIVNEIVNYYK